MIVRRDALYVFSIRISDTKTFELYINPFIDTSLQGTSEYTSYFITLR